MTLLAALKTTFENLRSDELEPVTVAVIDSGIDATHPNLEGKILKACGAEMIDGRYRIVEGPVPDNRDVYGHGTAVAGIITQIAPNARIIDIRVLNTKLVGAGAAAVEGFRHAIDERVRIINMSLAVKARFAPELNKLSEKAYFANQVVVAARRNMPLVDNGFPAEFSSTISVDRARFHSPFQVQFREDHVIEFMAQGEDVVVAAPGGLYTTTSGTSFATPAITGLAALLIGAYPDLRPFDVKSILRAQSLP